MLRKTMCCYYVVKYTLELINTTNMAACGGVLIASLHIMNDIIIFYYKFTESISRGERLVKVMLDFIFSLYAMHGSTLTPCAHLSTRKRPNSLKYFSLVRSNTSITRNFVTFYVVTLPHMLELLLFCRP